MRLQENASNAYKALSDKCTQYEHLKMEYEKLQDVLMRVNSNNTKYLKQQSILHPPSSHRKVENSSQSYTRRY